MQHVTKILVTVFHIFLCIKNVQVPEVIDKAGRYYRFVRIFETKDKKLSVFVSDTASKAKRPSLTFLHIHCLDDDWLKIQIRQNTLLAHFLSTRMIIIALEFGLNMERYVEKKPTV